MDDTGVENFDFDEWAELYRCDPAAFEARRQAVLMLELSRGEPRQRDAARAAMARYERAANGLDGAARTALAAGFMHDSSAELARVLGRLGARVERTFGGSTGKAEDDRES